MFVIFSVLIFFKRFKLPSIYFSQDITVYLGYCFDKYIVVSPYPLPMSKIYFFDTFKLVILNLFKSSKYFSILIFLLLHLCAPESMFISI